jgi:coenzyme PQQ precursor peptide PqqA
LRPAGTPITLERNGLHHHHRVVIGPLKALRGHAMAWTTPTLVEICIGLEINGYLPAEF